MKIIAVSLTGKIQVTYDHHYMKRTAHQLAREFELTKPIAWHLVHRDQGSLTLVATGADGRSAQESL